MPERALTVAVPAVALASLAWTSGGYFPETWGAVLLAEAIAIAGCAILATRIEPSRRGVLLVCSLLALAGWQLASRSWALAPDAAVLEAERTLMYAGAAATALLLVPRRRLEDLVLGVLLGTGGVTLGGLAEHLLGSGPLDERLELPIGYANASGILAATTLVLGLGLATEGPRWRRSIGTGLVPPAALALALSLSRGALVACAVGIAVLALTRRTGRSLARALPTAALVGALGVGALGLAAVGAHEVRQVRSAPSDQQGAPERLLSVSTSYRSDYWEVAAGMVAEAPFWGEGAGSFERVWLEERTSLLFVRDAHNLYLETLAELGPAGLALLLVALGVPFAAARRAVREPTAGAAFAGYVALLVHAGLDWDWELPALTACTVVLGVAVIRAGEMDPAGKSIPSSGRPLFVGAAALGALAFVVHAANTALVDAHDALDRGAGGEAKLQAERARRFAPWAAEPWRLLGEAEAARGRLELARSHIRHAIREDRRAWESWLALAFATTGRERAQAVAEARALNPLAPEIEVLAEADP